MTVDCACTLWHMSLRTPPDIVLAYNPGLTSAGDMAMLYWWHPTFIKLMLLNIPTALTARSEADSTEALAALRSEVLGANVLFLESAPFPSPYAVSSAYAHTPTQANRYWCGFRGGRPMTENELEQKFVQLDKDPESNCDSHWYAGHGRAAKIAQKMLVGRTCVWFRKARKQGQLEGAGASSTGCGAPPPVSVGVRVEAHSLTGAPHLNAERGIVVDVRDDRFVVRFDDPTHGRKALKPCNLRAT